MAEDSESDRARPAERLLDGHTVAVTADRRRDDQAVMFQRLGAAVLSIPVLSTVKLPDPATLRLRTEELILRPPDFLIANTGVGIRTWMACVAEWGLDSRLREALASTRIASRGPKAAGALTSGGFQTWWRSSSEQLGDVVNRLQDEGLHNRRVAFQLHGDDGSDVVARLAIAGAEVVTLPVYQWGPPPEPEAVLGLVERCIGGSVDAVTFTAGPQITALLDAAAAAGKDQALSQAFNSGRPLAGCIGPVCAGAATARGITELVVPANWRLGSMVKALTDELVRRRTGVNPPRS